MEQLFILLPLDHSLILDREDEQGEYIRLLYIRGNRKAQLRGDGEDIESFPVFHNEKQAVAYASKNISNPALTRGGSLAVCKITAVLAVPKKIPISVTRFAETGEATTKVE